jgi:hypothetical protein
MGVGQVKEGGVAACDRTGEHDLRLHARDSIDREAVLALKITDELAEICIEYVAYGSVAVRTFDTLQALAKPPDIIASHSLR